MNTDRFPVLGNLTTKATYRTEPALHSGAEIPQRSTLLVGQREPDPRPKAGILLGKLTEQTPSKNLFNWSVWLDATFPHVMLVAGKRGSGKSYDLGILAEGLCAPDSAIAFGTSEFAMILFDTQNQFWTLTRPSSEVPGAEKSLLEQWRISPCELKKPIIYRPRGTAIVADFEAEFALRPSDLEPDDWTALCGLERFSAMGQCLRAARAAMPPDFDLQTMIAWLQLDQDDKFVPATRDAVAWRLEALSDTGLFDPGAEDVAVRLASPGSKTVIQLADLDDATKAVVVGVILRKLIAWAGPAQRRRKIATMSGTTLPEESRVAPRVWVLIDEAHLVCPSDKMTAARPVVVDYVKRGRDAGLSLALATQQPSALDTSIISQCDLVSIHKLTIDHDISAATARMPARSPVRATKAPSAADISNMDELTRSLDSGQSLFADAESSRAFILQSRPRVTPHGGGEPDL